MGFRLRTVVLIIYSGGAALRLEAQTGLQLSCTDTSGQTEPQRNLAVLGFEKNLTTYYWNALVAFDRTFGAFSVRLNERFRSTIIQTPRKLIRDEQTFDLKAKHQWLERIAGSLHVNTFILSDDQKIGVSEASSHGFYGGMEAEVFERVFFEPLVGIRFDDQVGEKDQGFSFILGAWTPRLEFDGYQTTFSAKMQRDLLHPRTLDRRSARIGVEKTFFEKSRNVFCASYGSNQRDFYVSADSNVIREFNVGANIERRFERAIDVSNLLEYQVGERLLLSLHGNLFSRAIDQSFRYRPVAAPPSKTLVNTMISEFRLGGAFQALYKAGEEAEASLQVLYNERDERHSVEHDDRIPLEIDVRSRDEEKKNNVSRRTTLGSTMKVALSRSDRLAFSGSGSLLRYDTPSAQNVDDRDEVWYSFNLTSFHQINPYLHLRIATEVNLMHLVYLSRERSANNNWNRIIRLSPRLQYVPTRSFSTTNTFEVLANYTVYDFEETPTVQVQSFSFRQFAWLDSTRIALTSRVALDIVSHIRLYQRGELRWEEFKERPVNYFEDKTFIGQVNYRLKEGLLFTVGIRYFSQMRFGYVAGDRVFESILKSIGPLGAVQWTVGDRTRLAIHGWYERQTQTTPPSRGFSNMTMTLNVRI